MPKTEIKEISHINLVIKRSKILALALLLNISLPHVALSQSQRFGQPGNYGQNGQDGRDGRSGENITVVVDGQPLNYNIPGQDGENGSNGQNGTNAEGCQQPNRPAFSLIGANGGDGGNGGNGGDGGKGGDVLLYYTKQADLKQITINNAGGSGGQGNIAGVGGQCCNCRETQWSINYCKWELWRRLLRPQPQTTPSRPNNNNQNSRDPANRKRNQQPNPWILDSSYTAICSGTKSIDERENVPGLPSDYQNNDTWSFQWIYQGINHTKNFTCQSGDNGSNGRNGANGRNGRYGKFTLVPRKDIPAEQISYTNSLSSLLGQPIELVQNIWVEKSGLRLLLADGSNIPDLYTFLDHTVRLRYQVNWKANFTPESIGVENVNIGANINLNNGNPQVIFDVPGTLEYKISQSPDQVKVLTITGGFSPERIQKFKIKEVTGSKENNQLVVIDEGKARPLLKSMTLEIVASSKESPTGIIVSENYQEKLRYKYNIPPRGLLKTGLTENNDLYTFAIGKQFYPWLRSGNNIRYDINITQVTKMGTVYTQQEQIEFTAE